MKKETIEEAFVKFIDINYSTPIPNIGIVLGAAKFGAKWKAERMYSDEDFKVMVYNMVGQLAYANNMTFNGAILDELFNKFKNK